MCTEFWLLALDSSASGAKRARHTSNTFITMLIGDDFPELSPDLVSTLTTLHMNQLAHSEKDLVRKSRFLI